MKKQLERLKMEHETKIQALSVHKSFNPGQGDATPSMHSAGVQKVDDV